MAVFMRGKRNVEFDKNRNMSEVKELQQQVQQLQALAHAQEAQIQIHQAQAQAQIHQAQENQGLQLNPLHILNQFRGIKPLDHLKIQPGFAVINKNYICMGYR